jgi:hypothetical protein
MPDDKFVGAARGGSADRQPPGTVRLNARAALFLPGGTDNDAGSGRPLPPDRDGLLLLEDHPVAERRRETEGGLLRKENLSEQGKEDDESAFHWGIRLMVAIMSKITDSEATAPP